MVLCQKLNIFPKLKRGTKQCSGYLLSTPEVTCTDFTVLLMLNAVQFTTCHGSIVCLPPFHKELWQEQPVRWAQLSASAENLACRLLFLSFTDSLSRHSFPQVPLGLSSVSWRFFFLFSPWALFQLCRQSVDWFLQLLSIRHVFRSSFAWLRQGQHSSASSYLVFLASLFHFASWTGSLVPFFLLWPGFFHSCSCFLLPLFLVAFLPLFAPTGWVREE